MTMKTQLKLLAAAVGMTLGLGAQAALIKTDNIATVGEGAGVGNLVLSMIDLTANKSLVFNTGLTADSFNAQSNANFSVAIQAADLAKLNTFLGGAADKTKVKWNISAIDNRIDFSPGGDVLWSPNGFQFTAPVGTTVAQTLAGGPTTGDAVNFGVMTNMALDYFNLHNALTGANSLNGANNVTVVAADGPQGFTTRNWGNLDNSLNFTTVGELGSSLSYFFFHSTGINEDTGLGKVGSDKYAGNWTLNFDANGTSLAYSVPAAVPVPPALLLMGSAVAGLGALRRRKSA
ncbi:MAG: hypothetical protein IT492_02650 [Gammaproteobacteria bacterium]|nr:hypothetical protein [Gammaproteobacteria bacterium]